MAHDVLQKSHEIMDLRREAYAQIIKQLTNNKTPSSVKKAWELMLMMLDNIPPNTDLENYLEFWLRNNKPPNPIGGVGVDLVRLLHQTVYMGAPHQIPQYESLLRLTQTCQTRVLNLQVTQQMANTQHRPSRVAAAAIEIAGRFPQYAGVPAIMKTDSVPLAGGIGPPAAPASGGGPPGPPAFNSPAVSDSRFGRGGAPPPRASIMQQSSIPPPPLAKKASVKRVNNAPPPPPVTAPPPENPWQMEFDEEYGVPFFYRTTASGEYESTWDRPPGYVDA